MKYCTLFKTGVDQDAAFVSCDAVDDDHRFGFTADQSLCHVEGVHLPDDRIVAFGMARGSMTDLYPELTPPAATPRGFPVQPDETRPEDEPITFTSEVFGTCTFDG